MKISAMLLSVLIAAVVCMCTLGGCQCSQETSGKSAVKTCPACNTPTKTVALKDVAHTKGVCTDCKKVKQFGPNVPVEMKIFLGESVSDTVDACDNCKAVVGKCPDCTKKAGG